MIDYCKEIIRGNYVFPNIVMLGFLIPFMLGVVVSFLLICLLVAKDAMGVGILLVVPAVWYLFIGVVLLDLRTEQIVKKIKEED